MKQLLLPYAYDTNNNLVHIENARKGQKYFCPNCHTELVLRISKIPDGLPYHKIYHFAHKGETDNHCSESYLHKHFKNECAKLIRTKISQEARLNFEWICQYCQKKHNYNLLSNVTEVITEYNLKECRPDIALVDNNNNIIFAIEVCVKHFPESKVLQYYSDNNISCIVIVITDFADCDNIEKKLTHPSRYFLNPKPFCDGCDKMINRKIPKKTSENTVPNRGERPVSPSVMLFNNSNEIPVRNNTIRNNVKSIHSQSISSPKEQNWSDWLLKNGEKKCPKCGSKLQINNKSSINPSLECVNFPKCDFTQNVDSIIWSGKFR